MGSCIDFKELRKEISKEVYRSKIEKYRDEENVSDSDGEAEEEDLDEKEKEQLIKKYKEVSIGSNNSNAFLLPKVAKPSLVLPSVMPTIMHPN